MQPIAVFVRENHLLKQKIHLTLSHRKRSSVSGRSSISLKYFLKRVEKKRFEMRKKGASCASCLEVPPLRALFEYVQYVRNSVSNRAQRPRILWPSLKNLYDFSKFSTDP